MANINEFAYALNSSARPNQFKISITFPSIVSGGQDAMRSGTYLVKAGTIPEVTIEDVQVYYRGRQYHEAGEKTFQPWTCSIYNSGDFKIRKALEDWANQIQNSETTAGITSPQVYKSEIKIEHLDRNGQIIAGYKLIGAFPNQIGPIQLDFESGNQLEMFDVTFIYDYFVPDDSSTIGSVTETISSVINTFA